MASILTQVYKEAATTSKGVVQMNRTLDKIYADQLKANKAQAKFLDDLRTKNKREEREEKKRQSDLRKLISGRPDSGPVGPGGEEEEEGGGLLAAITSGLGMAFNLLRDLLLDGIGKRFRGFFRGGPKGRIKRPPAPGTGGNKGRSAKPGTGGNKGRSAKPGTGGNKGNKGKTPGGKVTSPGGKVTSPGGKTPPSQALNPNNKPTQVKPPTAPPPSNAIKPKGSVKELPWWRKAFDKLGQSGLGKAIRKWGGPLVTIALMVPDMVDMYNKKEYKNLTRYVIASLAGSAVAGVAGSAVTALAALVGIPTGGVGGVATFIAGMGAAITAGNLAAGKVDEWLMSMGLADEDTSTGDPPEARQLDAEQVIGANENIDKEEAKEVLEAPVQKRQKGGGIFDVPGHGQGDQVPMMLPPGSFVLNRVAAGEMFARGGEPSGLVPTLLEPGEKVFMPGDPLMGMAMAFNETFSRFQTGGVVDDGASRGKSQPSSSGKAKGGSGKGVEAILSAAESNIGLSKGSGEQCANTTRAVLKAAGHPAGTKTTQRGDLDPEGTKYNGPGFAASFAGSDMGAVNKNFNSVKPGEVMLWKDTYKKYSDQPAGAITHVGIAGKDNMQYDHSKARGWEKVPRESRNFAASIDLNGEASGDGGESTSTNTNSSSSNTSDSGGLTGMFSNMFSGLNNMFGGLGDVFEGMGDVMGPIMDSLKGILGPIEEEMKSAMGEVSENVKAELGSGQIGELMGGMKESMSSEMSKMNERIQSEMTPHKKVISSQVSASSSQVKEQMKKIKEAMNPEEEESTVVQVIPGGKEQQPTVEGMTADNRPFQVSTRCPSWAAADYRYDRSLNTPTQ
jgi:hypothetical protein